MAAYFRNFQLLGKLPFSRFVSMTFHNNLLIRRLYKGNILQTTFLVEVVRKSSNILSKDLKDGSRTRSYHTGKSMSIRASELSKDKPLQKADIGCPICRANISFTYKDILFLSQFLSPQGNLLNKRVTGVCGKQQIKLEKAIKISRRLGLLPKCGTVSP